MAFKLTHKELAWLKRNLHNLTTKAQFAHVMANRPEHKRSQYTTFRTALYNSGLKKCKILRWTPKETQLLLANYQTKGNIEIAEMLSTKKRPFTKKNVEKKMVLMGLNRTKAQKQIIIDAHKEKGTYSKANKKRWKKMGVAEEGERRVWICNGTPKVVVKINGTFVHYARHRYLELHGTIKPGNKVYMKDGNPLNVDDSNLIEAPAGSCRMKDYKKHIAKIKTDRKLKKAQKPPQTVEAPKPLHKPKGVPVRIDRKTIVFVKPGTNIEQFKKAYENRPIY